MLFALTATLALAKPNIILMLVDDLGWKDLGYAGSDIYQTPNIDRLAAKGVRFERAYSAHPVCSPTRAAIMTGKNPVRVGVTDWIPGDRPSDRLLTCPPISNELALSEVTLAERLKEVGYRTYSVGKWHLGGAGFLPTDQGFDVNIGGSNTGQPGSYFAPFGEKVTMPSGIADGEYITDRLTDEAIKLIERPDSKPFFLHFPQYSVHTPIQAKPEDIARFASIKGNAKYAAMIWNLDQNVGRLISHLEAKGRMKNTIVLFTSDNGGLHPVTNNAPLRGSKAFTYEGGVRVPAFAYWPAQIKSGAVQERVISMDFSATILEAAGSKARAVDGSSIWGRLLGGSFRQTRPFIWHYPQYHSSGHNPSSAILDKDWKLIHNYEDESLELYNLKCDPFEQNNLTNAQPERAEKLWLKLRGMLTTMGAKFPTTGRQKRKTPGQSWR